MCGIVGIISKRSSGFQHSDQEMFRRLLIIDGEFRGLDSTGVFQVQNNRQVFLAKSASIPALFMSTPQWTAFNDRMFSGSRVVIGHNRKSTMGATVSKNAHPFHEDNIILVHNGTLHNHKNLSKEVEVDSHAVCKAFAEGKADEVLPTIDGAFAFVWWDIQKDRLFAIRNKERPLSLVETADNLYIASEPWMVIALLCREGMTQDKFTVTELPPGELFEIDVFSGKAIYKNTTIELAKGVQHAPFTVTNGKIGQTGHNVQRTSQTTVRQNEAGSTTGDAFIPGMSNQNLADCTDCSTTGERQRANVVSLFPDYNKLLRPGTQILFKATEAKPKGVPGVRAYQLLGHITHPTYPNLDIQGTLLGVKEGEIEHYLNQGLLGKVMHVSDHVNGPVVHVKNIIFDISVKTFSERISYTEWEYAVDHCKCSKCSSDISIMDSETTFIRRLALGEKSRYHIECKDCLDHTTKPKGKVNEEQQSGDSSVQDGKRISQKPGGSTILRLPSPSTANPK